MLKRLKPYILLLITAMIWGFAFVAQLVGAEHVPAFTFNATRFFLGTLSLIPVILIFEKGKTDPAKLKITIIAAFGAGAILFTASALQQYGVQLTSSAGKSGFITGLYMIIVPIIGIFFKKKTTLNTWLGALVALVGLYLLSFPNGITSIGIGDLILLIGAFFWAAHIIVIDAFSDKIYSLRFSMIQFFVCALMNVVCVILFEDFSVSSLFAAKIPILYAGLMSVGIAYTLQVIGQRDADPTVASIVMSTESVFSAVGEALFFGLIMTNYAYTKMTPKGYLGCAIMFCGIIITQVTFKRKSK